MFWNKKKKKTEVEEPKSFTSIGKQEPEVSSVNIDEQAAAEFRRLYMKDARTNVQFAESNGPVGISIENNLNIRSNDVFIVNASHEANLDNIIVPIMQKANTSYIVYDPNGEIYGKVEGVLKKNKYDIRIIDFAKNADSTDRVDIFEAANLLQDPTELVRIMSRSFENKKDQDIAAPLIEAVCQYILEKDVPLNAARVAWVLRQLKHNNKKIIGDLECSPLAGAALKKRTSGVTADVFFGVIDELERRIAPAIEKFGSNPSIYGILTTKKNVAIFVKCVEPQYRFVATSMMYNLMVMSTALNDASLNTIVLDEKNEEWYDREEVKRWSDENKNRQDCTIRISIMDRIPSDMFRYFSPCVIFFNGSVDRLTIDYVHKAIEQQYELTKDDYPAEQIVDRHELETMTDGLIFCNTNNKGMAVRPFRAKLLSI